MSQSKPDDVVRLDSSGRDVTDLPGLWSDDDKTVDNPLAVAVAELFDVPIRCTMAVWNAMDKATKQQLICDIVDVGRK